MTPDTPPTATVDGLWLSVSAIADRKGVTKQSVSERVAKLVHMGKLRTRPGKGKTKLVNLAEFDRLIGETTDLAREQGALTKGADRASRNPTFTQHQAERAGYEAALKRLELEEKLGQVLHVQDVRRAMEKCAGVIVREIDQLPNSAEEIAAAFAKGGSRGVREVLKKLSRSVRDALAANMKEAIADNDASGERKPS